MAQELAHLKRVGNNWVEGEGRAQKEKAKSNLQKAMDLEKQRIESGKYHWVTFIDQAGRKSKKMVKKSNNGKV